MPLNEQNCMDMGKLRMVIMDRGHEGDVSGIAILAYSLLKPGYGVPRYFLKIENLLRIFQDGVRVEDPLPEQRVVRRLLDHFLNLFTGQFAALAKQGSNNFYLIFSGTLTYVAKMGFCLLAHGFTAGNIVELTKQVACPPIPPSFAPPLQ